MTYGEARRKIMQLIFYDTIAGDEIPATYNEKDEYLKAIPGLINTALLDIATTRKFIPAMCKLSDLQCTEFGPDAYYYEMPADCWQKGADFLIIPGFRRDRFKEYRNYGKGFVVRRGMEDKLMVEYWRYPERLNDNPSDKVVLDSDEDACEAMIFYVASELLRYDDAFRYASLYNEWITRKDALSMPMYYEYSDTEDVYCGFYTGIY